MAVQKHNCTKCNTGVIQYKSTPTEIGVKKCTNKACKYQFGIKEFQNTYLIS